MTGAVQRFGASTRGPRNRREGNPNQDAWGHASGAFGDVLVVCDGMGSRPGAQEGSRAACRAVKRAARLWRGDDPGLCPEHLIRLVEALWRIEVAPLPPGDCATTCSLALRSPSGGLLIAGLGDGLALVRGADGTLHRYGGRGDGSFANETLALGVRHRLADWWSATYPAGNGRTVVLLTDGVADDLAEEHLPGFMEWLRAEVSPLDGRARWRRLEQEFHDWPVPHHVDDKTIAVMTEREEPRP